MKRSNAIEKCDIIPLLPDDIWNEILQFTFHDVGSESATTYYAICSRRISLRLKDLIDRSVFAKTKVIHSDVACWLSSYRNFTLNLFKNVDTLYLTEDAKFYISDLKELPSLQTLILNHNESIQVSKLKSLTNLTSLSLNHVYFNHTLLKFTNLTSLEIGGIYLDTDMSLLRLPKLEHLSLYHCHFDDDRLATLTQLKSLMLEEDSNIIGESFAKLTNLEKLSLNSSNINFDYISALSPSLKELIISHEQGYVNEDNLRHLTKLERLHINNSPNITNINLSTFTTLKSLSIY